MTSPKKRTKPQNPNLAFSYTRNFAHQKAPGRTSIEPVQLNENGYGSGSGPEYVRQKPTRQNYNIHV